MAPGPWISVPDNPEYFKGKDLVGEILECRALDDSGGDQNTFVGIVEDDMVAASKGDAAVSKRLKIRVLGAGDKDYWSWIEDGENPLWYHLSPVKSGVAKAIKNGKIKAFQICELRLLTFIEGESLGVTWLSKRHAAYRHIAKTHGTKASCQAAAAEKTDARHTRRHERELQKEGGSSRQASKPALFNPGSESDEGEEGPDRGEGVGLGDDLRRLRSDLLQDDAPPRGSKGPSKEKDKGTDASEKKGKRERAEKDHGRSDDQRRDKSPREKDHGKGSGDKSKKSPSRGRSPKKTRKKSRSSSGSKGAVRPFGSANRSHKGRAPKDKKKHHRSRSRSDRRKKSRSESRSSDASQVFRDASSSQTKPSRARLIQFAEDHPGRLAERLLNKMLKKVVVEGEASETKAKQVPAVVKAYHLRVTSQQHSEASKRHMGEAAVIAHVLDHLAARRFDHAADILAQRYTSLEALMGLCPGKKPSSSSSRVQRITP